MRVAIRSTFLAAMFVAAGGCTAPAIVLQEDTESVSQLIDASVAATREFYADQGRIRFEYMVAFIAARPSCGAESPLLIKTVEGTCLSSAEKKIRLECKANSSFHTDCESLLAVQPLGISPQLAQPRQTTISLIAAVAAYQRILARVLKDETYNSADELNDLKSRLDELSNKVRELRNNETSSADSDDEFAKQAAAVGALVDLLRRTDENLADYRALKRIVGENGPVVDNALDELLKNYEKVDKPLSDLLARRDIERKRTSYNRLSVDERNELDFEEREGLLRAIFEPELTRLKRVARPDALAAALRRLIRSHRKLEEGFKDNLTVQQKRRIAEENQKQLKAAFSSMFSIVKLLM